MTHAKTAARPTARQVTAAPRKKASTTSSAASSAASPAERDGDVAKVFMSGRSQAVRLPKAYRFDTAEVTIKRVGRSVVLTPKDSGDEWGRRLMAFFDGLGPDGIDLERPEEWPQAERESIDPV